MMCLKKLRKGFNFSPVCWTFFPQIKKYSQTFELTTNCVFSCSIHLSIYRFRPLWQEKVQIICEMGSNYTHSLNRQENYPFNPQVTLYVLFIFCLFSSLKKSRKSTDLAIISNYLFEIIRTLTVKKPIGLKKTRPSKLAPRYRIASGALAVKHTQIIFDLKISPWEN